MISKSIRLLTLGTVFFAALSLVAMRGAAAEPPKVDVFVNGDGYRVYRIPSLICTPKGTLLAFCEGRSGNDQSPTDMVLKRSLDCGKTWLPMQVLVKAVPEAALNPTAVIDRTTETVVLVYDRWPKIPKGEKLGEHKRDPGLGRDSVTTWIMTSKDDGATWSTPIDITARAKKTEWTETGHGPGLGIQTRSGRLVIPCFETKPIGGKWGTSWNFIIYSDDHGKTWQMSENEVGPNVNESQVVELADGSLLLNMRSTRGKGCRAGAISKDGGKTWSKLFDIPELPDAGCQASLLRYTWPDAHGGKSRILYSKPATSDRHIGMVRLSYDEAKTWPVAKMICKDYFGYSCLTAMPDGTIGCLFETAGCYKIAFISFSLQWLTDGKDSLKRENERNNTMQVNCLNAAESKSRSDSKKSETVNITPGNWSFTDYDAKLAKEIQQILPGKVFDFHAHIHRVDDMHVKPPHFVLEGPRVASIEQWRKHIGRQVGVERLRGGLFMPNVSPACDITKANEFVFEQLKSNPQSRGLILVTPNSPKDKVEEWLSEPGIVGFKPYYMYSTETPVFESSIEGYAPDWMWRMADERGLIMTIHLVRKGALSDPGNQAFLRQQCTKHPRARIVLAHCARGFHAPNTLKGLKGISELKNVWFDTSALCESDSIVAVLKAFGAKKLLWGTDFCVSEVRGKAITIGDNFYWLTPDMLGWEKIASCNPTLIGLESLRAVCEAANCLDLKESDINDIFHGNAVRLLKMAE